MASTKKEIAQTFSLSGTLAVNGTSPEHSNGNLTPEERTLLHYESRHPDRPLVALQKHVVFWDQDCDGIIWPHQVYEGFRALGFCIPFALGSLLIPLFFSYPTRLGHSWIPDPFFRIYVNAGHKCIHGSDTGIYTFEGHFHEQRFEEVFTHFDRSGTGGLSAEDLLQLLNRNRCAWDILGWFFAFMEWWTTWLLMQKDGRVWKDDLRACYDGTLFWKIQKAREPGGEGWEQGYGFGEFFEGMYKAGTWRHWEIKQA
jgi:peroxygenase